ncbi:hypothetical protein [Persicitalea sp.]|uniref:hypothetical protein n=1 Tax=Persicitalea sp. TaxID=3100273 RepID=UPI00359388E4
MNAVLLASESSQDIELLLTLAKKMGMTTRKLSTQQWEDHMLAVEIDSGMKSATVSKEEVMKVLNAV